MASFALWCRRYGLTVVLIFAIRIRYFFSPLTTDEGGYVAIARAWSHGATLYKDVWVDRPQGLLAVFAILDRVGLSSTVGIRVFAGVVCVVAAVACGHIAATLVGNGESGDGATPERARRLTALFVGVLVSVPQVEGFIANGEILSCTAGAIALALVLSTVTPIQTSVSLTTSHHEGRRLFAAGIAAGVALSLKQSGFDVLPAVFVVLFLASRPGHDWPEFRRRGFQFMAGLSLPMAMMAIHGAITGWQRWWYAVVAYRLEQRSAVANARWTKFIHSFEVVGPVICIIAVMCLVLFLKQVRRERYRSSFVVLSTWAAMSLVAFAAGGNFFRHYWIILMFPIGTILGVVLSRVESQTWFNVGVVAALLMPIGLTARILSAPRDQIGPRIHANSRLIADEEIAQWFAEREQPGDRIYALCASAGLYALVDTQPPFSYLWFDDIGQVPNAVEDLVRMLSSADAPKYVARYQPPDLCDPTGQVKAALVRNYRNIGMVSRRTIYQHR